MKLNGKQYDKFILNGKTYEKFYLNNKIYQSLDPGLILDLPLQNNFTDYSASGISMVAANANGFPSFVSDGSGGYALDFGGTKGIKTSINFPINTRDAVTVVLDIRTTQTTTGAIINLATDYSINNAFAFWINYLASNKITSADHKGSSFNLGNSITNVNSGAWINVAMVIDRSLGINQNKIYINKVLSFMQNGSFYTDINGVFGLYPLVLGLFSTGTSNAYVGQIRNVKIFNYPLSAGEITAL